MPADYWTFMYKKFLIERKLCNTYLDRKTLLSRPLTASLVLRQSLAHPTPSVFHADQRGVRKFFIRTLGPEIWGHPHPHGEPQHQQGQGLILGQIS